MTVNQYVDGLRTSGQPFDAESANSNYSNEGVLPACHGESRDELRPESNPSDSSLDYGVDAIRAADYAGGDVDVSCLDNQGPKAGSGWTEGPHDSVAEGHDNVTKRPRNLTSFSESQCGRDEFATIMKEVGELGPWQWFIAFFNMLMTITAGIQNNSYPMLVGSSNNWAYGCKLKDDSNFTLNSDLQSCEIVLADSEQPIKCSESDSHEMVYQHEHFDNALLTEFHLMCGYANFLVPLVHSAFTIGCFFGVFLFGWLGDWVGRKKALCVGVPIMIVLNFSLTFSPNIYVFLAVRLLQGVVVFGTFTVAYVISMETTAPSRRAMIGNVVHIPWGLQFITVALIAMWLKHWRYQQIVYSIPSLLCLVCVTPLLSESPRWLAINGKIEEATQVLLRGAKWNGKKVSEESIRERLESFHRRASEDAHKQPSNLKLAMGLVKTPEMRRRFLFSAVIWFQGAFTNHGINFYAPQLAEDPYLAYCLVGFFEFISPVIGAIVFTYGRRLPLIFLFAVCGFISYNIITVMKVWPDNNEFQLLAMLLFATFLSDMAFNGIYVHVSEFMPTTHRSIGLGSCSAVARIGSSLSSILVSTASSYPYLPPVIFGTLSLAGSFCTYMLPSTENQELPETIEDVEEHGRERRRGLTWLSQNSIAKFKANTTSGVSDHVASSCNHCDKRMKRNTVSSGLCDEAMIQNVTCV
ncbi:solute carrier family 22 member 6-like isoform X2 [Symsagittifera roscoffensis]|uniref:solute carrier family 22 member 6-like isoform X2 n=1 Tax=Symsagittifera roscoffensis TaxID=84072 RepID=UPI00307BA143